MGTEVSQVYGYVRVSTVEQEESGAGLDAQTDAIRREVKHRGWTLAHMFQDVASGKTLHRRPQLEAALAALDRGEAGTLMVYKLDRLSRSVVDFGSVMERAKAKGWNIVIIDLGVDLATPAGEMVATIMASLAQWERRVISQRTVDGLAAKKRAGVRLGRPSRLEPDTVAMIRTLRASGMGLRAIASELNRHKVPTSQLREGGIWHASSVRAVLSRQGSAAAE